MPRPNQIFPIDTSSLIRIRELFGRGNEGAVLRLLTELATNRQIVYPPEVSEEIERGARNDQDPLLRWIRSTREVAERRASFDNVRRVLTLAPDLVDADNVHEEADPYLVALGLDLRPENLMLDLERSEGMSTEVIIITDDRIDKPRKLSLATAAGVVGLPSIPMFAFLRGEGLRPPQSGAT